MKREEPEAFKTCDELKSSYWGGRGKFQALADKLEAMVPSTGEVKEPKKNRRLEKFRRAANGYYDLYNNGLGNRPAEFRAAFGFSGMTATAESIEAALDRIVLEAAVEQGIISEAR